jgi:hypothetical protein
MPSAMEYVSEEFSAGYFAEDYYCTITKKGSGTYEYIVIETITGMFAFSGKLYVNTMYDAIYDLIFILTVWSSKNV